MAIASGPTGPVLAGPVSVFAFKTAHVQMITNKAMQHCESNNLHQLAKVIAAAINTSMQE